MTDNKIRVTVSIEGDADVLASKLADLLKAVCGGGAIVELPAPKPQLRFQDIPPATNISPGPGRRRP